MSKSAKVKPVTTFDSVVEQIEAPNADILSDVNLTHEEEKQNGDGAINPEENGLESKPDESKVK